MKNLFFVVNKEKIYAYVVSIMTIVTIFFMSSIINKDLSNTEQASSNVVENDIVQEKNKIQENKKQDDEKIENIEQKEKIRESKNQKIQMRETQIHENQKKTAIGEAISTSIPHVVNNEDNLILKKSVSEKSVSEKSVPENSISEKSVPENAN